MNYIDRIKKNVEGVETFFIINVTMSVVLLVMFILLMLVMFSGCSDVNTAYLDDVVDVDDTVIEQTPNNNLIDYIYYKEANDRFNEPNIHIYKYGYIKSNWIPIIKIDTFSGTATMYAQFPLTENQVYDWIYENCCRTDANRFSGNCYKLENIHDINYTYYDGVTPIDKRRCVVHNISYKSTRVNPIIEKKMIRDTTYYDCDIWVDNVRYVQNVKYVSGYKTFIMQHVIHKNIIDNVATSDKDYIFYID